MRKIIIFVIIAVLFISISNAQLPDDFKNLGFYKQVRVTDNSGDVTVIKNANLGEDTITGSGKSISFNNLKKLENKTGDYGITLSLAGDIAGCLIGAIISIGTIETEEDEYGYETTTYNPAPIYILGIGGAIVGYVIGISMVKYETLYDRDLGIGQLNDRWQLDLSSSEFRNNSQDLFINVSYKF